MPSWCGRVSRLKDACHSHIIFEIIHVCINVHHVVSLSSFSIPIYGIFVETLLKCHGTSSYIPITNIMIHWHCTLTSEWGNTEIPSNCSYMHRNLTWLDKTHAFTVWEGFKAQGFLTCLHMLWDHPCLHQRSSCSIIVIIHHSHLWNLCRNSLEMSWNIF